jgi:hypothetical protein
MHNSRKLQLEQATLMDWAVMLAFAPMGLIAMDT